MLLTDTTILLRCCLGVAMKRVERLRARGVLLATTDRNAEELVAKLMARPELNKAEARDLAIGTLDAFGIVPAGEYDFLRSNAAERLAEGGKNDWPLLAAAMALDAEIWSDDRDFFGVGIPVWTTPNVRFVPAEVGAAGF